MSGDPMFLSSTGPAGAQRRLAQAVVLVSMLFCLALAPFARTPLAPVPAFLPIYQTALVVCDLITTVLLFGQFAITRSRAVLVLGAGYLFGALMAVAHALSFPGLFAPGGWISTGTQTTAWLYFLWHAGFPLYIVGYAVFRRDAQPSGSVTTASWRASLVGVALAAAPAAALILLATAGHELLPPIMAGDRDAPLKALVAAATWLFAVAGLVLLWRRRPHSVLDLWLMVVVWAWLADSALAAVLNHGRYDLGWYAGRMYGLLASGFVLVALLLESGALHGRLAQAHRELEASGEALAAANAQLETANHDLKRFVGAVAHDLQQPILSISGYAQQMKRRSEQLMSPADAAANARIIAIAENADRMIQGLLQFARLGQRELELEAVDLNRVVDEARVALAREIETHGVNLRVAPLPQVSGDAALLGLAFINLLSNAIKYSRGRTPPVVDVDAHEEAGGRIVRIRDNGVGFDMKYASRLFSPFERLHSAKEFEGTGMGLANVRRIMERHGGAIRAEATPDAGATFFLVFPGAA
jgi:signal transduction histidine kinase